MDTFLFCLLATYSVAWGIIFANGDGDVLSPGLAVRQGEPTAVIAQKNGELLLNCSVEHEPSLGTLNITWQQNGGPVELGKRIQLLNNGSLYFRRIIHRPKKSRSDVGLFDCIASLPNIGSIIARRVRVQVADETTMNVNDSCVCVNDQWQSALTHYTGEMKPAHNANNKPHWTSYYIQKAAEYYQNSHWTSYYIYMAGYVFSQNKTLGVYCGPYRPPLFMTTLPVLSSIFTSGCCANGKGLSAVYTAQDGRCGEILINKTGVIHSLDSDNDGFYDNNQNCWWVMVAPHNGIIDLDIRHMAIELIENCEHDYIWLYDGDITTENSIGWLCGNFLPPSVRTTYNSLFLQFYSDAETSDTGFIAQYRHAWPCGASEENLIGQFGSVDTDADGFYDHNVDCVWFLRDRYPPTTIQVYITKFDIPPSMNCSVDYLQVYDDVQSYGTFCGTDGPPLITTTERVLSVEFHTECCLNGGGFSAVYSVQGDCGGILLETTGVIESHDEDGDGRYDDNANCWWTMVAPPDTVIELKFISMAIQDHAHCNYDYIQIYNGEAAGDAVFGYYCGHTFPPIIRSTSNILYLQFVSDSYVSDAGFRVEYRHFSARPCGTTENQFFGTFAPLDADDDGLYDNNLNCAWEIHSFNPARITSFYLTEFEIPASSGCSLDYLKIYDEERSYGIFCGTNRPPLITTTEIVLHIEFQSDCCINGKGFLAVFVQHGSINLFLTHLGQIDVIVIK